MAAGFSLKDQLFNRDKLVYLAGLFQARDPAFPVDRFVETVMRDLPALELKQRITLISNVLEDFLPDDFGFAADVIQSALPPPLDPSKTDNDFGDFIFSPLSAYVARRGLTPEHLRVSLNLMEELTQRFSVELDIRAFLNHFPDETLVRCAEWAKHENYHVRRLVSEGTRPKLPWGGKISIPVTAPLPFLDSLHADPTRYVTRSVANHLNDIAKIDPDLVLTTLARWHDLRQQEPRELNWMTRHALRGLVKKGHAEALAFLGYNADPDVDIVDWSAETTRVRIGDGVRLTAEVRASEKTALMVDYVVDMPRPDGSISSKVFKLKKMELNAGEQVSVSKSHRFVKNATTITYYPGTHLLHLQVNGARLATQRVELED